MWGEEKAREMLEEAGFGKVEVKQLPYDLQNSYYIAKKRQGSGVWFNTLAPPPTPNSREPLLGEVRSS